jgi:hypothetical protein
VIDMTDSSSTAQTEAKAPYGNRLAVSLETETRLAKIKKRKMLYV